MKVYTHFSSAIIKSISPACHNLLDFSISQESFVLSYIQNFPVISSEIFRWTLCFFTITVYGQEIFLSQKVKTNSRAHSASYLAGIDGSVYRGKVVEHEANRRHWLSVKVNTEWGCASPFFHISSWDSQGWCVCFCTMFLKKMPSILRCPWFSNSFSGKRL